MTSPTAPYPPRAPHRGKRVILGLLCVFAAILVAGFVVSLATDDSDAGKPVGDVNPLELAQVMCDPPHNGTRLEDGGATLLVDGKGGDDFSGVDLAALGCILDTLKVPEAVKQKMSSTRALDGRQDGRWSEYDASWTYHPDNGLDLIITRPS